jgi:flagellar assembly factor FliW
VQIPSTRFGQLNIKHSDLLLFPQGIIGFESFRHWVLLSDSQLPNVAWLQSVGSANTSLALVSPRVFASDYRVHVSQRQLSALQLATADQLYVLSVVSKSGHAITMNLKSPVLINLTRRLGLQTVCSNPAPMALPIGLSPLVSRRLAA